MLSGPLSPLQLRPQAGAGHVQELAMYDDYINYYGFPRELGFIRTKQLLDLGEAGALIELIIPRVSPDGAAAQFRVNAVAGQSMLSMCARRRAPLPARTSPPRARYVRCPSAHHLASRDICSAVEHNTRALETPHFEPYALLRPYRSR